MSDEKVRNPGSIKNLEPARDPELDKLRDEVLNSKEEVESIAKDLASQLTTVHAAYLFSGQGRPALSQICAVISSTPVSSHVTTTSSWKDLASLLGLTFHQICCIENYKYSDCTETVLKTYSQKMDSTLDKIVLALQDLKRYDAITVALPHLQALEKYARREQVLRTEQEDSGYFSIDGLQSDEPTHDGILRPSGIRHLISQLHITLRNVDSPAGSGFSFETTGKIEDNFQNAAPIYKPVLQKKSKCSKRVLLTFAKDGETIAFNVATELRKPRGQHLPIGVLILDEHYDLVEANPEQFISHIFPKMDYVFPIITPKYLDAIDKNSTPEESISAALDVRYVQMIHTLMIKHYVGNSCRNDKFRSIIPDKYVTDLLNDERMKRDLVLQAFTIESKLESLALRILKKKNK